MSTNQVSTKQLINLSNSFVDNDLGIEMRYPEGWEYVKSDDGDFFTVSFRPIKHESRKIFMIMKTKPELNLTSKDLNSYVSGLKEVNAKVDGKSYDEGDYIYKFDSSLTANGREFKEKFVSKGEKATRWVVVIPGDNSIYTWSYASLSSDEYDSDYQLASAVLDSWKIAK